MSQKIKPEEISELFGKLKMCHCVVYSLYCALKESQPEICVLREVSVVLSDSIREIDGYIDTILNPSNYEQ